jgi:protein with PEP-CTERM/exosortase system signal
MKALKYLPILFAIAIITAPFAQAVTFNFTSDHTSDGAGTPPFGSVTLTQNGANVDFTVTLFDGSAFILSGASDRNYFLFNGTGVAVGDIINITQNFTGFILFNNALGPFSTPTGDFSFGITSTHGNGGSPPQYLGPLSFTVANATIADLTQGNGTFFNGQEIIFAADILSGQTGNTGLVDATTPTGVPDGGATVMLLGAALTGLGLVRRYLKH